LFGRFAANEIASPCRRELGKKNRKTFPRSLGPSTHLQYLPVDLVAANFQLSTNTGRGTQLREG